MIGQTERDYKGVEAQFMKKKILVLLVCSMLTLPTTVSADILDYEGTVNAYKEDNKIPQTFEIDDGSGEKVTAVAKSDKVSVSAKATYIRSMPGKNGKKLVRVYLGTGVERVAVCDNGWSKVTYEKKSKKEPSQTVYRTGRSVFRSSDIRHLCRLQMKTVRYM